MNENLEKLFSDVLMQSEIWDVVRLSYPLLNFTAHEIVKYFENGIENRRRIDEMDALLSNRICFLDRSCHFPGKFKIYEKPEDFSGGFV